MSERRVRIRPITIMALLGVGALVAAGLFAWDRGDNSTGSPAKLPISVASSTGAAASGAADIALAPVRPTVYVAAPNLPALGGTAHAWRLAGAAPDQAAVARLGQAFGVHRGVQSQNGGWTVGVTGGSRLVVSPAGTHAWSWSYNPYATVTSPPMTCARPLAGSANIGADDTVATPTCGSTVAPPAGVPDEAAAVRQARSVLEAGGFDLAGWKVTATSDPYSATVTASPVLDGVAVEGLSTVVTFGARGAITYGSGWFGTPERADSYPLVGTKVAMTKLQQGDDFGIEPMTGATVEPDRGTASRSWTHGLVPPASGGTTTTAAATGSSPGSSGDRVTPVPTTPPTAPATTVSPSPLTVTIDQAEMVLVARLGTDGSMWLVPAYRLSARSGGSWTVLAVDRRYLAPQPAIKGPIATIEPPGGVGAGTGTGTGSSSSGTSAPAGG